MQAEPSGVTRDPAGPGWAALRALGVVLALLGPTWAVATVLWAELDPTLGSGLSARERAAEGDVVAERPAATVRLARAAPRAAALVVGGAGVVGGLGAAWAWLRAAQTRTTRAPGGAGWTLQVREEAVDDPRGAVGLRGGTPGRWVGSAVLLWTLGWVLVHTAFCAVAPRSEAGLTWAGWWGRWPVSLRHVELWALSGGWALVATAAWGAWERGRRPDEAGAERGPG
jgi:hypothetical protein